jgi:uncharacterized protein (TIGR03435 family)
MRTDVGNRRADQRPPATIDLDGTGLDGRWRFGIAYSRGDWTGPTPPLPTVLREDLGLRLEQRDGPVDVIVIESVERPSEN